MQNQGIGLLDEALDLARLEMNALQDGAFENAVDLAKQRGVLTGQAWDLYNVDEHDAYHARLSELNEMQQILTEAARRIQDKLQKSLARARQEKRRMRGYHLAVGQALMQ